jgi:hypothetical protein
MSTMRWDRLTRLTLWMVIPFWSAACGNSDGFNTVPAAGTVTFKGKPLESGQIQLLPEKDGPASVGLIENGKFILGTQAVGNGAPPGKYRVTIFSYKEIPNKFGSSTSKSVIPDRYTTPDTSGLVVEIPESGNTEIKIELAG